MNPRTAYRLIGGKVLPWVGARFHDVISGGIVWLLNDSFLTDLAAGAVDGTSAEPGPGARAAPVDSGSNLSLSGGSAVFAGGAGWGDPGLWYGAVTRAAGRLVVWNATVQTNKFLQVGLDANQAGGMSVHLFNFSTTNITIQNTSAGPVAGTFASGEYYWAIALRTSGAFFLVKGGAFANWTLLFIDANTATTPVYPGLVNNNADAFSSKFVRSPDSLWLPTPLLSDGFGGNVEDADGLGHAEGVATGIGEGGTGTSVWLGGEWGDAVSGITITPTEGADLAVNGDFSTWTGDNPNNWTVSGESAPNREITERGTGQAYADTPAGTGSICLYTDSGTSVSITQAVLTAHNWYKVEGTISSLVSGSLRVLFGASARVPGKSTGAFSGSGWATTANLVLRENGATNATFDNVTCKALTINTLFSDTFAAPPDLTVQVDVASDPVGENGGVVARLDSTTSPANFIVGYHDGTWVRLDKCVAGVFTQLLVVTVNFVADATVKVVCRGSQVELWYNGVQRGATQTVGDAGILSNTIHGAFATDSSVTLDNLQGIGTWTNASGVTKNTVSTLKGPNLLTDADMETDPATNWTQVGTPTTFAQSAVQANSGTYSLHMVTDAANEGASQTVTGVVGRWYRFSLYGYKVSGTWNLDALNVVNTSGGGAGGFLSWAQSSYKVWRASTTAPGIRYMATATGAEAYMDDAEITEVPTASMIKSANLSEPDVVVDVTTPAYPIVAPSGLIARLDDPNNPANYIHYIWYGAYLEVTEFVAGVPNQLGIVFTTFAANDTIRLILDGSSLRAIHITSAGTATLKLSTTTNVTTGNYVGMFSSEPTNTLNNFVCYARGTDGEYDSVLDQYIA